jgi:hypothetical protein
MEEKKTQKKKTADPAFTYFDSGRNRCLFLYTTNSQTRLDSEWRVFTRGQRCREDQ